MDAHRPDSLSKTRNALTVVSDNDWGVYQQAIDAHASFVGRKPPKPYREKRGREKRSISDYIVRPHFFEWLMGLPEGYLTEVFPDEEAKVIKMCGNGVVPEQAVAALTLLLRGENHSQQDSSLG